MPRPIATPLASTEPLGDFCELAGAACVHCEKSERINDVQGDNLGAIISKLLTQSLSDRTFLVRFFCLLVVADSMDAIGMK